MLSDTFDSNSEAVLSHTILNVILEAVKQCGSNDAATKTLHTLYPTTNDLGGEATGLYWHQSAAKTYYDRSHVAADGDLWNTNILAWAGQCTFRKSDEGKLKQAAGTSTQSSSVQFAVNVVMKGYGKGPLQQSTLEAIVIAVLFHEHGRNFEKASLHKHHRLWLRKFRTGQSRPSRDMTLLPFYSRPASKRQISDTANTIQLGIHYDIHLLGVIESGDQELEREAHV